jgi:hypothetical protein
MSLIPPTNQSAAHMSYSQNVTAVISITFEIQDSASTAGQDRNGMPIYGKHILANYRILSPLLNIPPTTAPSIRISNSTVEIQPWNTYTPNVARQLWAQYISPRHNHATIDLATRVVTI